MGMEPAPYLSVAPVSTTVPTGKTLSPPGAGWLPRKVEIEFWKIGYEVATKKLFATRQRTVVAAQSTGER